MEVKEETGRKPEHATIISYSPWDRFVRPVHTPCLLPYLGECKIVTKKAEGTKLALCPNGVFQLLTITGLKDVTRLTVGDDFSLLYQTRSPDPAMHMDTVFPEPFTVGVSFNFEFASALVTEIPEITYRYYEWTDANRWISVLPTYSRTPRGHFVLMSYNDARLVPEIYEVYYSATVTDADVSIAPASMYYGRVSSHDQNNLLQLKKTFPVDQVTTNGAICHSDPPCMEFTVASEYRETFKVIAQQICPDGRIACVPRYELSPEEKEKYEHMAYLKTELAMQQSCFLTGHRSSLPLTFNDIEGMDHTHFPRDDMYRYYLSCYPQKYLQLS